MEGVGGGWENVFLLTGDDLCVHLYREAKLTESEVRKWWIFSYSLIVTPPLLYFRCISERLATILYCNCSLEREGIECLHQYRDGGVVKVFMGAIFF